MGLDQYLVARLSLAGYDHAPEQERKQYNTLIDGFGFAGAIDPHSRFATVEVVVGYWRKANAIHDWFVRNVQDGEDDCRSYDVSREKLSELRDLCQTVLDTAEVAPDQPVWSGTRWTKEGGEEQLFEQGRACLNSEALAELLPTAAGFFFGSTAYDEWYLQQVEETIATIDRVLANTPDGCWFKYESSW